MTQLQQKEKALFNHLRQYPSLMVAVSGGVDSMYLLYAAHQVLGENVLAATALSEIHPGQEALLAEGAARSMGIPHVSVHTEQMHSVEFLMNSRQRCYVCKKIMFAGIIAAAEKLGVKHLAHGANRDDDADFRPGLKACREMGVSAPLAAAGLDKADIRALSKRAGLSTWDKPASGCLATRIPYGSPITREKLARIEKAEQVLVSEGFTGSRVRFHGDLAKIEVPENQLERIMLPERRRLIVHALRQIGFLFVTLDMEGFQSGRLNRGGGPAESEGDSRLTLS